MGTCNFSHFCKKIEKCISVCFLLIKLALIFYTKKKKRCTWNSILSPLNLAVLPVLVSSLVTTLQYLPSHWRQKPKSLQAIDKAAGNLYLPSTPCLSSPSGLLTVPSTSLRYLLKYYLTAQAPQTTPFITEELPQPQHTLHLSCFSFPRRTCSVQFSLCRVRLFASILTYWLTVPKRMKA